MAATAIVAILLTSFAYDQQSNHQGAIARAERDTRNAALLVSEHAARVYGEVEETLKAVLRIRQNVAAGTLPFDSATLHHLVKAIHGGSPVYYGIGWIDAQGNQAVTSRFLDPPPLNIAQQEHFRVHRDRTVEGIFISKPFRSVRDGRLLINVSMAFTEPDGRFGGIVAAALDPVYLAGVYRGIELGPSRVVTLFRSDGAFLVREPHDESLVGQTLAGRPFITDIVRRAPSGTFRGQGLSDGAERIISYAQAPGVELIATVALSLDDALADFHRGLAHSGIRVGATAVVLVLAAWLLASQTRRRELAQADLQVSEAKFRDFASLSGDWLWETDAEHRFVWLSDSVEQVTGVPAAWHYGKSRMELAAAGVASEIWEEHRRTLHEHRPFRDFEYLRRGPTGDRWMRSSGLPIFDESGRFRGYRGSGRDVTGLRRAEQRLSDAVEAIPGGFLLFNAKDRLVYVNRNNAGVVKQVAELHRIGDTFENTLRRTVAAGLVDDAVADPEAWIAERLRQHRAAEGAMLVRNAGRTIETIERPTHDGGTVMLRFDVTERENAAEAQRQASEAAEAANRAKSDFLSRMSHELRTPLNAVIGFAQMLQLDRSQSLSGNQKEYSDFILNGGKHLLNLVNEVLDLAGIEAGRLKLSPERVAVAEVVSQAMETMRPVAAQAGVSLEHDVDPAVADVRADLQRLRQVLLNLLSNAIKYNRPGGSVTVATATVGDGRVRLVVTDTGIGIAPEHEAQLFEPFHRLGAEHTAVEGTGIGLALSKRLIEAMDGRIGYTTKPGEGSAFWFDLPSETGAAPMQKVHTHSADVTLAAAGGYSLLYVEDNPANLRLMEHLVGTLPDVAMLSAPSGPLGIDLALGHRPDVIVLDLNLPGISGYEVLKRLKGMPETRDIPVIALTAAAMPSDLRRGMTAGFFRYVTKPLDVNAFLSTVNAALADTKTRRATGTIRP